MSLVRWLKHSLVLSMQASTEPLILQQAFVAGFFNTRENSLCDEGELKNV